MYNFTMFLGKDEQIIEFYKSDSTKVNKNIGGELFIIGISLIILILMILGLIYKIGDFVTFDMGLIILFLVDGVFIVLPLMSIIDKIFLKAKKIEGNVFCLTNKKVIKYEKRLDKVTCCYLKNIDILEVANTKGRYGDLVLHKNFSDNVSQYLREVRHQDDMNRVNLILESVETPGKIKQKIKELKAIEKEN